MPEVALPAIDSTHIFNIADYGAVGDGRTLNTEAIAKAIAACAQAGGGEVIIPPGLWVTGPIRMVSHMNLVIERGALVQFTRDLSQYPMGAYPVYAHDLEDVAITGSGIMDGGGDAWRPVKQEKTTEAQWKELLAKGGTLTDKGKIWWPPGTSKDSQRPYMIYFDHCQRVLLQGVTFRNSPKFVIYPTHCRDLTLRDVNVFNEWWAQNGDGIDISASTNVLLYRCNVSAGDDGICLKSSGTDTPLVQNVVIAACNVYHAHGGFVIGSNTDGGIRNVYVADCNYVGTDVGIRVKSNAGRGGLVRDIYIDRIFMSDIAHDAISFDTYYEDSPAGSDPNKRTAPIPGKTPVFTDFHISHVYCLGAAKAISLTGLPQSPVRRIFFDHVVITAGEGLTTKDANEIELKDVTLHTNGLAFQLEHPQDIRILDK